jgi:hypothetical protein
MADLQLRRERLDAPDQPARQVDEMAAHRAEHAAPLLRVAPPTPRPGRIEPVPAEAIQRHVQHRADIAFFDQLAQVQTLGMKAQFVVDHGKLIGRRLRRCQHRLRFSHRARRRLLTDHMFAGLQRCHGNFGVHAGGVQMLTMSTRDFPPGRASRRVRRGWRGAPPPARIRRRAGCNRLRHQPPQPKDRDLHPVVHPAPIKPTRKPL